MMKVFKPFWSYDIHKTEAWLNEMSAKGLHLNTFNRWTRYFFFQKGEPKANYYRIGYDKLQQNPASSSLISDGWKIVCKQNSWYILSNDKAMKDIKTSTVRTGIIKRNRILSMLFFFLFCYFTATMITNLSLVSLNLINDGEISFVKSPLWSITFIVLGLGMAFYILLIYSIVKLKKINRILLLENEIPEMIQSSLDQPPSKKQEKLLKRDGKIFVRRKYGWMYAPDKLETWLEGMEQKGFHLYRVNKFGTSFYFKITKPRLVSFCTDYQNISDESYLDIHKEAGWHHVFSSFSSLQKWTIWSKEYTDGESKPRIYTEPTHIIKQAKKVALAYSILFMPLIIMYLFIFGITLQAPPTEEAFTIMHWNLLMYAIAMIMFGSFVVRSWLYYFRMKI
ncbi:DUF2812 domain-containing protein [Cytobacillus purgationiresistens]|uniref:DUF2812 domain-containing protein n=1 Tax=Cytobacillus purgationiresistens TaxID=863449 RepID=A0ABU0AKX1_9BACI|nr:DUF2812 domain-containing protein [Cytobacillus purgationiresistens]MDQ0271534.1 hypothetical protein [Cytobacillus purgationiresistens]